jgi:hypothetical protein
MIYFIQNAKDGYVKIGLAAGDTPACVSARLHSLQISNPYELKIIGFCRGGKKEEEALHRAMKKFRVSGEWFALTRELIEVIKTLSVAGESDRKVSDETISVDRLAILLQKEYKCDLYYKTLISKIVGDTHIPSYKVFGQKRYKYEECMKYIYRTYMSKKE